MQPKSVGGLGLINLVVMNKACLFNLGWKLMTNDNNVWCQIIRGKYDRGNSNLDLVSAKRHDSSLWKNVFEKLDCNERGNTLEYWKLHAS